MKYFSLDSVNKAYEEISHSTKDKFWGIWGILYSINKRVLPNVVYNVDIKKLAIFLENTFRLKEKKSYNDTDGVYNVIFSNKWVEIISNDYIVGKPSIMPILVWAFRRKAFNDDITAEKLFELFLNDFHLDKKVVEQVFTVNIDSYSLELEEKLYDDDNLFFSLGGDPFSGSFTIKMNNSFVVANSGDLSRGPFFQPLYASLNSLKCLTIYPFDINGYYNVSSTTSCGIKDQHQSLQQIFYGAPGTGKSNTIKRETETAEKEGRVIRTTFHPDSDYSTFVGTYKPTMDKQMKQLRMNLSLEDIAKELGGYYNDNKLGKIGGIQKFCLDYYKYIDGEYMSVNVSKLLELAGVPETYSVEINKYLKFCQQLPKQDDSKIIYTFCPQAFTNAYVKAWSTEEKVYLVIEEINRGNCAQIFGDLFQLLDRKKGVSEYPVEADTDLRNYLQKELADTKREDIPENVKSGEKLMLPKNFYIWATMNTSDQSLFPIDSAFKRRWEWKYMKIKNHPEENYRIKIGEKEQDWWEFIKKINEIIASMTSSADKQLGYFFCCAKDRVIDEDTFVSKVIFYLWNDVFKDYGFEDASLFRYKDENGVEHDLTFPDFYDEDGEKVNTERLTDFVKKVMDWKKASEENA